MMAAGPELPLGSEFIVNKLERLRPQETFARVLSNLESTTRDFKVLAEVDQALKDNQITFYLQPQCNSETRTIIGMEALVRWVHPERGLVSPGDFIPTLERAGLIANVDTVIWEKVCQTLGSWEKQGKNIVPISINVSIGDIECIDVAEYLSALCEKYQVDHKMLRVEITESLMAQNMRELVDLTSRLRELEFKVLMDDFGSGYSSLNMLKDTNIDVIKLDMQFIDLNSENYEKGSKIIEYVVEMSHQLGLPVIAEGVESHEQLRMLHSFDCIYVQGYKFYKPMPVEYVEVLLAQPDTEPYWDLWLDSSNRDVTTVHYEFVQNVAAHACDILADYLLLFARVNLITADFEILNCDSSLPAPAGGMVGNLASYSKLFIEKGIIAPEFIREYKERTNVERLRSLMLGGARSRLFTLRTTLGGDLEWVTLGFVGKKNCSPQNPWCVFFVRKEDMNSLPAQVLEQSYEYDTLTGLYNFEKFKLDLHEIPLFHEGKVACAYMDVFGLHEVNNHIGHAAGDEMLEQIGSELRICMPEAYLYRLGGDEFLAIAPGYSEEQIAKELRRAKKALKLKDIEISGGYAVSDNIAELEHVVELAEQKMLRNKRRAYAAGGKGRQLRMLNERLEATIQEQRDVEQSFSMILPNCTGVYVVNMLDDTMRCVRAPEGFRKYAEQPGATFSDAARSYTFDSIEPRYQHIILDLLDYEAVRTYLWSGRSIQRYYERKDGACFDLQIYPYSVESVYKDYALWVFTKIPKET